MKIERIVLCYPTMDRIIVDGGSKIVDGQRRKTTPEEELSKYDLSRVTGYDVNVSLSPEEFISLREIGQRTASETGNAGVNSITDLRIENVAQPRP